jgi:hypothetical protein
MIDLRRDHEKTYRIVYDPSVQAPASTREDRLYAARIACKYGHIGVWGPDLLSASTDRRLVMSRLAALPFVRVVQTGDAELQVVFPPEPANVTQVAQLLRAYRRKQVSDAERARLAAMSAAHGFRRISDDEHSGESGVSEPEDDPGAIPGPQSPGAPASPSLTGA